MLVVATFMVRRDALVWTPAWLTLGITGALEVVGRSIPTVGLAAGFTGTMFPFVMLVGALRFAQTGGQRWALSAGLVAATVRLLCETNGLTTASRAIAFVVDPLPLLAASAISLGYAAGRRPLLPDIFVGPSLLLLAGVEAYSGYQQFAYGTAARFGETPRIHR